MNTWRLQQTVIREEYMASKKRKTSEKTEKTYFSILERMI